MVVINIIHNLSFASSGPNEGCEIVCILWKLLIYALSQLAILQLEISQLALLQLAKY